MFQHYVSQIPMCTFEKAKTQALNGTLDGAQTSSTRCTSDGRRGRLKVSMDMWIKRTVSALAEPHPRKNELHMDKVAPKDVLRMFKDDCKYGAMQVFNLYKGKSARGRDKFDFHPSTFRKRWAFRLTKGLPKVYLRLHKGVSSKCYSCSRFNRRIKVARTRPDREYWEQQKRLHLKFVYEERVLFNEIFYSGLSDPKLLVAIIDGWDSCKTVIPSYACLQGELGGMYKNFLKTKLTGVMFVGYKLFMLRTFPWVGTGANLTVTALVWALAHLQASAGNKAGRQGAQLPPHLHLLVDGGAENVNKTVFGFAASLLVNKVFELVTLSRLPVGHTHNQLDQQYQAPSQHFHGDAAVDAPTPHEFMQELKECYSKVRAECATQDDQTEYDANGGYPTIADLLCTYNYDEMFLPSLDRHISGHRTRHRVFEAPTASNPHRVIVDSCLSSELHVFEIYLDPRGTTLIPQLPVKKYQKGRSYLPMSVIVTRNPKPYNQNGRERARKDEKVRENQTLKLVFAWFSGTVRLRCKTSLQAKTWFPAGAQRNNEKGIALLDPQGPPLPPLDHVPERAEFNLPFKREEAVVKTILGLRQNHPDHMTQPQHEEWVEFLENRPQSVQDVAAADLPPHILYARTPGREAPIPPPSSLRTWTDRSVLDVAENPTIPSFTHAAYTPAQRNSLLQERTSNWRDSAGCEMEVGTYCFVRTMEEGPVSEYRLPWDLVRIIKVSEDKKTADVYYNYEYGGYTGDFRTWLPAGSTGNAYYRGTVIKESVEVFNVPRTGSKTHSKFKLTRDILKKLGNLPEGEFRVACL
jgi:hypothetical protein